jgi:hypothetical protein
VLASVVRASIVLVPIGAGVGATYGIRSLIPPSTELGHSFAWWLVLVVLAGLVAFSVGHLSRRLMPLVTLLKLSMLFPDRAPSRFAVARQAGSVKRLRDRLAELDGAPGASHEASSAATILSLATALQSHDRRTRGHAERVRVYTDLLGEELKLSKENRYRLRWAALLHDIGKLTISPEILNKPGKLDEREWEVMRRHPLEGTRLATPLVAWLGPWARAIIDHHERYDGAGYPNGLAGESISLAGRIVAVADAYDTMTAARSYKRPMPVRLAREELANCAGGQFDPMVVRAFLAISLPRLVWRTGPLSFLAQTPLLSPVQEVGRQIVTLTGQGVAAATIAVGITAATVASPSPAAASGPVAQPSPGVTSSHDVSPSSSPRRVPTTNPTATSSPRAGRPIIHPRPTPASTSGPTPRPSPSGSRGGGSGGPSDGGSDSGGTPSGTPAPPSPSPAPSPTDQPKPSPSPSASKSGGPLPLPSVSLPPLPTPSLPLPSVSVPIG